MLWLGRKLFRLREKLTIGRGLMAEDEEKPFLEHLEDLRKMLMRMIITLLLAMIGCFTFEEELVRIVQYPMHAAKVGWPQSETLPSSVSAQDWIQIKRITRGLLDLPPESHAAFLAQTATGTDERLRPHAEALRHYSASLLLPAEKREAFLRQVLAGNAAALESALGMLQKKPDSRLDRDLVERGGDIINMMTLGVAEGFNTTIKLSLIAGIIVSFPFLLYFFLLFVLPGLKPQERKVLWSSLGIGVGLFLVGVCFAYFIVLPKALEFFYNYTRAHDWKADYRFSDYSSFVTRLTLIFGLGFELPVVVYALIRLGLLSFSTMRRTRGYAVLVIAVVSAIITPTPDAGVMLALMLPLVGLYEACIWLAYFHERAVKKREAAEEAERRARRERANLASAYIDPAEPSQSANPPDGEVSSDHHHDDAEHPVTEGESHSAPSPYGHAYDSFHAGEPGPAADVEPHEPTAANYPDEDNPVNSPSPETEAEPLPYEELAAGTQQLTIPGISPTEKGSDGENAAIGAPADELNLGAETLSPDEGRSNSEAEAKESSEKEGRDA
ncbi:MAG: twin-arginine translocase subunit TatC [Verrucomicrobiales bacterium]